MWGSTLLETHVTFSHVTGFPNQKSYILLYLAKWQYFWWFWFSSIFILYYNLIFLKFIAQIPKFNPIIMTSKKSHGKWGDLIICILPIFWCINILSSSNVLLKSLEWQTEAFTFTVRVRGKQWFWTYKMSVEDMDRLLSRPIIIGRGKMLLFGVNSSDGISSWSNLNRISDKKQNNQNLILHRNHSINLISLKSTKPQNLVYLLKKTPYIFVSSDLSSSNVKYLNNVYKCPNYKLHIWADNLQYRKGIFSFNPLSIRGVPYLNNICTSMKTLLDNRRWGFFHGYINTTLDFYKHKLSILPTYNIIFWKNNILSSNLNKSICNSYRFLQIKNIDYSVRRLSTQLWKPISQPIKYISIKKNITEKGSFLKFRFINVNPEKYRRLYLTVKQLSLKNQLDTYRLPTYTITSTSLQKFKINKSQVHSNYIKFKNQRLLNVDNILILPTKHNITFITNSFDVVHSWFIPGLGLKLDCVPGRSTHHSIFVRTPGFYYGQCAEICGRFHHHMPIKLCFLPFEHFILLWNHFYFRYLDTPRSTYFNIMFNYLKFYPLKRFFLTIITNILTLLIFTYTSIFLVVIFLFLKVLVIVIPKQLLVHISFILLLYFVLNLWFYFVKLYKNSIYTSFIQRFWKRTYFLFWSIEGLLFVLLLGLYLISPSETSFFLRPYYINNSIFRFSKTFTCSLIFLSLGILINFLMLGLKKKNNIFLCYLLIFLIITNILVQEMFRVICNANAIWVVDYLLSTHYSNLVKYPTQVLDCTYLKLSVFYPPQTELVLSVHRSEIFFHILIDLLKFWHLIFIFIFSLVGILKTFYYRTISMDFLAASLQNIIYVFIFFYINFFSILKCIVLLYSNYTYFWFYENYNLGIYFVITFQEIMHFFRSIVLSDLCKIFIILYIF